MRTQFLLVSLVLTLILVCTQLTADENQRLQRTTSDMPDCKLNPKAFPPHYAGTNRNEVQRQLCLLEISKFEEGQRKLLLAVERFTL